MAVEAATRPGERAAGRVIGVGMLGSGFIGEFHTQGLRHVPNAAVVANYGRGEERREEFAKRHATRIHTSIDALCADPDVDLVVVSLPNELHVDAVRSATRQGKAVACTKPLGRNAAEAAEMLQLVLDAGVWHGYLENVVFNAGLMRVRELIESGALGRPTTLRAREGHSGPHAEHFWDADVAGGGALLDMGAHGVEAARYLFGKQNKVRDVFSWGATFVHGERTTGEDNALTLVRFEDERVALVDNSWSSKGGLEGRFEVFGTEGRAVADLAVSGIEAFIGRPAGFIVEKADAETGWVFPVPNEVYSHGHDAMMQHMLAAFTAGQAPSETFRDGYIVNAVIDAGYRSQRSGQWEPVELDAQLVGE